MFPSYIITAGNDHKMYRQYGLPYNAIYVSTFEYSN